MVLPSSLAVSKDSLSIDMPVDTNLRVLGHLITISAIFALLARFNSSLNPLHMIAWGKTCRRLTIFYATSALIPC